MSYRQKDSNFNLSVKDVEEILVSPLVAGSTIQKSIELTSENFCVIQAKRLQSVGEVQEILDSRPVTELTV